MHLIRLMRQIKTTRLMMSLKANNKINTIHIRSQQLQNKIKTHFKHTKLIAKYNNIRYFSNNKAHKTTY